MDANARMVAANNKQPTTQHACTLKVVSDFLKSHAEYLHGRAAAMHSDIEMQRALEARASECVYCCEYVIGLAATSP